MRDNLGLAVIEGDERPSPALIPRRDDGEAAELLRDLGHGSNPGAHAACKSVSAAGPRTPFRRAMFGLLLVAGGGLGAWYGSHWWSIGRFIVSTDDAYVRAHNATLAA